MLETAVAPCERCPIAATRAVASRGPVPARLLLLSGAPRYHEEHEGLAFASPAFSWLEGALAAAGLDPASVHYATLTACRPPHQRPLRDDEIAVCRERLDVTINAVAPEVIVVCGADAAAALLPGITLSAGHGRLVAQGRRRYYPIRHPYAALHYESYVAELETDLRRLAELLAEGRLDAQAPPHEDNPAAPAGVVSDVPPAPARSVSGILAVPAGVLGDVPVPVAAVEEIAAEALPMTSDECPRTVAPVDERTTGPTAAQEDAGAPREEPAGLAHAFPSPPTTDLAPASDGAAAPDEEPGPAQLSLF